MFTKNSQNTSRRLANFSDIITFFKVRCASCSKIRKPMKLSSERCWSWRELLVRSSRLECLCIPVKGCSLGRAAASQKTSLSQPPKNCLLSPNSYMITKEVQSNYNAPSTLSVDKLLHVCLFVCHVIKSLVR